MFPDPLHVRIVALLALCFEGNINDLSFCWHCIYISLGCENEFVNPISRSGSLLYIKYCNEHNSSPFLGTRTVMMSKSKYEGIVENELVMVSRKVMINN